MKRVNSYLFCSFSITAFLATVGLAKPFDENSIVPKAPVNSVAAQTAAKTVSNKASTATLVVSACTETVRMIFEVSRVEICLAGVPGQLHQQSIPGCNNENDYYQQYSFIKVHQLDAHP